jgi:hypothetical protein
MELVAGVGALIVAGALYAYKIWGKKYLKKWLDDPATPEDESAVVVNLGERAVKMAVEAAVAYALTEALKNPRVDVAAKALEHLKTKMAGVISDEDAKKLISAALAGQ